jgi:hypothetical protein
VAPHAALPLWAEYCPIGHDNGYLSPPVRTFRTLSDYQMIHSVSDRKPDLAGREWRSYSHTVR